jgi:DNA polymerase-3 subunit delta'
MADRDEPDFGPPAPRRNPILLGQKAAEATFLRAYGSGRLAHAWLISGPRGVGKATFAYRAARFLLAHGGAAGTSAAGQGGGLFAAAVPAAAPDDLYVDPESGVFRRAAAGGHADFISLEPGWDDKRDRRRDNITVNEVREVGAFLSRTAAEGGWRVVVVDSADDLNASAANALLKVLEEPPSRAILFLVAHNPARLLATIRSRCRRIVLGPLPGETVIELLGRFRPETTEADREELAILAEGSAGRALSLAAEGGLELYRDMLDQLERLPALDVPAIHRLGDKVARDREGDTFRRFSELLTWWLGRSIKRDVAAAEGHGADRGGLESRIEVWEKITQLLNRAESANLDRKQLILNTFHALRTAARP